VPAVEEGGGVGRRIMVVAVLGDSIGAGGEKEVSCYADLAMLWDFPLVVVDDGE
jgi:hypothetical protein